ncbi:beta strand repeat-containing protein [Haloarcula pelagica]|nr:Ig-like domain-containing protein [Halomicroarcula sp. YJ-61-S]
MVFSVFGGTVALSGNAAALSAGNAAAGNTAAGADTTLTTSATIDSSDPTSIDGLRLAFDQASADDGLPTTSSAYSVNIYDENGDLTNQGSLNDGNGISYSEGSAILTFSTQDVQTDYEVEVVVDGYTNPSTDGSYSGEYQLNPDSNGPTTGISLQVGDGTGVEVTDLSAPAVAAHDQDIIVTANVTNTGGSTEDFDVSYSATGPSTSGAAGTSTQTVNLGAGETTEVSFTVNTTDLPDSDASAVVDYTHGITATGQNTGDSDSQTASLSVGTDSSGTINIDVIDQQSNTVTGTNVSLYRAGDWGGSVDNTAADPIRVLQTDNNGFVNFENLAVGAGPTQSDSVSYVAVAGYQDDDFDSKSTQLDLFENTQRTDSATLRLERVIDPASITVDTIKGEATANGQDQVQYEVTVRGDVNNDPFQGAEVTISATGPNTAALTYEDGDQTEITDENGTVRFNVSSTDEQEVTFTFEETSESLTTTATGLFTPQSGEGNLYGSVVSQASTNGIENGSVHVVSETDYTTNEVTTTIDLDSIDQGDADDNTVFLRLNDSEGSVISPDEYDIRVAEGPVEPGAELPPGVNPGTGVTLIDELNSTDAAVGGGYALVDTDGDGEIVFSHTRLEARDYYAQVSFDANNASDYDNDVSRVLQPDENPEAFVNVTGTTSGVVSSDDLGTGDAAVFEPSANLTVEQAVADSRASGANLADAPGFTNSFGVPTEGTNQDGDYVLSEIPTNYQAGVQYVAIAQASGYSTDFQDVYLQEDGQLTFTETQGSNDFFLEPVLVQPDAVNITQIGLRDNASATATDEFSNKSDEFVQQVPRNGRTVDAFLIETSAEGTPANATVEVSIDDTSVKGNFTGVESGTNVSVDEANNNITITTGPDGAATVLYQADSNTQSVVTNKTAVLSNDESATDNSTVEFVGQLTVQEAEVSGIVTNENNDPVPANVYLNEINLEGEIFTLTPVEFGQTASGEDVIRTFRIDRLNNSGGVIASDTFNASYDSTPGDYDFSGFTGVSLGANVGNLTLATLSTDGVQESSSYTLPRIPSVDQDPNVDSRVVVRGSSDTSIADAVSDGTGFSSLQNGTSVSTLTEPQRTSTANVEITGAAGGPFQVNNVVVTPNSTSAGTAVDVSADVTNSGAVTDSTDVTLSVEDTSGTQVSGSSTTQTIAAGQTESVNFTVDTTGLSDGNYTVFVDTPTSAAPATANLEIEAGTPSNPPNYTVNSVTATPSTINQSENLTVDTNVTNVGGPGAGSVSVEINGTNVSTGTGQLDIIFLLDDSSSMDPFIQDLTDATQDFAARVDQSADAQYAVVTYGDGSVQIQQTLSDNVTQTQNTLGNVCPGGFCSGGTEVNYDAINESLTGGQLGLRANARPVIIDLTDEGNNNQTNSDGDITTPTQSEISTLLEDENAKYIAVTEPDVKGGFQYPAADDKRVLVNETADAQYFNINSQNLSDQFANEIAGDVANASGGQSITLNTSESGTVTFDFDSSTTGTLAPGDYTVTASTDNSSASTNLTVQAGSSPPSSIVDQYDTNGTPGIQTGEVLDAIVDFNNGQITQGDILDIIVAFNS